MFGIASRYVKARTCPSTDGRKAPAFHIPFFYMQGKSLAFSTTKFGNFAELNATNLRRTEINLFSLIINSRFTIYLGYHFLKWFFNLIKI